MFQVKARKIFFAILLFSLSTIISSSYSNFDSNQKSIAFAQTPGSPVPENTYTDPGAGPIPEDNSTDNIGNGPIPEDNPTSLDNSTNPGLPDFGNLTSTGAPIDVTTIDNNATSQSSSSSSTVPEFGSLAGMIITISIIGIIVASKKFRLHF